MTKGYAATFLDCEDTPSSTGPEIKILLVKLLSTIPKYCNFSFQFAINKNLQKLSKNVATTHFNFKRITNTHKLRHIQIVFVWYLFIYINRTQPQNSGVEILSLKHCTSCLFHIENFALTKRYALYRLVILHISVQN